MKARQIDFRYPFGQISTIILACGLTWIASDNGWTWALSEWDGWPALSVIVLVASWVNVFAWLGGRWVAVVVCSLLTIAAPWGFIYPGILAGPILAIAAGLHWARDRERRRSEPSSLS
jgi:hypothetical protein